MFAEVKDESEEVAGSGRRRECCVCGERGTETGVGTAGTASYDEHLLGSSVQITLIIKAYA